MSCNDLVKFTWASKSSLFYLFMVLSHYVYVRKKGKIKNSALTPLMINMCVKKIRSKFNPDHFNDEYAHKMA